MEKLKGALRSSPKVETRLARGDLKRLDDAAAVAGKSRSDFARQALLWYLDNQEKLTADDRESKIAQAIRHASEENAKATRQGVDRICKMLARQGVALGTMFELSWMSMPPGDEGARLFEAAMNTAKQQMRKHVEKDEAEIADRMKKVAGAGE